MIDDKLREIVFGVAIYGNRADAKYAVDPQEALIQIKRLIEFEKVRYANEQMQPPADVFVESVRAKLASV